MGAFGMVTPAKVGEFHYLAQSIGKTDLGLTKSEMLDN
jgi:hypothetical protein